MLLDPVLVAKPWGGRRLAGLGVDLPADGRTYGEAWVVADLDPADTVQPDPASRVRSGPWASRRLSDLVAEDRESLLGDVPDHDGRFPLLVKLLDAREHLSVQVHPPAAVLDDHPSARLKTESWVVLEADPGAELFLGLADDVTHDQVRDALGTPALVDLLRRVPAHAGEVFHVPAGLVHALGAGVVVAEVQTPSDTTWRLYDWVAELDRPERELHLDAGWDAIAAAWEVNTTPVVPETGRPRLLDTAHYVVDRLDLATDQPLPEPDDDRRPRVVMVLEGGLGWGRERLGPGGVVLVPPGPTGPHDSRPRATTDTTVLVVVPGPGHRA
nr:type I phosphomannose isomerase catalytic subunit [Salsipaludibacter albus]